MKGQVAIEFLSYSTIFFLAMAVLIAVAVINGIYVNEEEQYKAAKILSARVANAAALTLLVGKVNVSIDLPPKIGGKDYTVALSQIGASNEWMVKVELDNGILATHALPKGIYKEIECKGGKTMEFYQAIGGGSVEVSCK